MNSEAKKKAKELIYWAMNEYAAPIIVSNMRLHKHRLKKAKKLTLKICEETIEALNQCMLCKQSVRDFYQEVKTEIENYEG